MIWEAIYYLDCSRRNNLSTSINTRNQTRPNLQSTRQIWLSSKTFSNKKKMALSTFSRLNTRILCGWSSTAFPSTHYLIAYWPMFWPFDFMTSIGKSKSLIGTSLVEKKVVASHSITVPKLQKKLSKCAWEQQIKTSTSCTTMSRLSKNKKISKCSFRFSS